MPDLVSRPDDTVEKRFGEWAFRQVVVVPIIAIVVLGIIVLINVFRG